MREQIEQRLAALRQEQEAGLRMLADLENRRAELQHTLLRIDGAAAVLEELLGDGAPAPGSPAHTAADDRAPVGV